MQDLLVFVDQALVFPRAFLAGLVLAVPRLSRAVDPIILSDVLVDDGDDVADLELHPLAVAGLCSTFAELELLAVAVHSHDDVVLATAAEFGDEAVEVVAQLDLPP